MEYNELLNKLSSQMSSEITKKNNFNVSNTKTTINDEDTTSIMLNKIGLEVQRQGGY